jgi:hypothetical protein
MKAISRAIGCATLLLPVPVTTASAGPGFAYSWLSTDKTFDQCISAAQDLAIEKRYPVVSATRFGVTAETGSETLYINCEDATPVSMILMRGQHPKVGEIDALIEVMLRKLATY